MEKTKKIVYWIATALLAFGMLQSGILSVFKTKAWIDLVTGLGYPDYFLVLIGVWKILGVIAILIPGFYLLKEWAYAGFFFAMTGALVSHFSMGNISALAIAGPSSQIMFIILSWYFRPPNRKLNSFDQ